MSNNSLSEIKRETIPAETYLSCSKLAGWKNLPIVIGEVWSAVNTILNNHDLTSTGPDTLLYSYDFDPNGSPAKDASILVSSQWPVNPGDLENCDLGPCTLVLQKEQKALCATYAGKITRGLPFPEIRSFADKHGYKRNYIEREIYHSFMDVDDENNRIEIRCYLAAES